MYCELKDKEIELKEHRGMLGNEEKIFSECSENNIIRGGVKINCPCQYRMNTKCLQLNNRIK